MVGNLTIHWNCIVLFGNDLTRLSARCQYFMCNCEWWIHLHEIFHGCISEQYSITLKRWESVIETVAGSRKLQRFLGEFAATRTWCNLYHYIRRTEHFDENHRLRRHTKKKCKAKPGGGKNYNCNMADSKSNTRARTVRSAGRQAGSSDSNYKLSDVETTPVNGVVVGIRRITIVVKYACLS